MMNSLRFNNLKYSLRFIEAYKPQALKMKLKLHSDATNSGFNNEKSTKRTVCIVGGGFNGLYTALRLEKILQKKDCRHDINILLIDKKEKFEFLPLLYELTVGTASLSEVAPTYKNLLTDSKIEFIQANVDSIDTINQKISCVDNIKNDRIFTYDYLVVSAGAQPRTDLIPGASEFGIPFYTSSNAYELRMKLRQLESSEKKFIKVAVIGAGYSGVEIASNIAEYLGENRGLVTIIDRNDRIMSSSPEFNRKTAEKCLTSVGVTTLCGIAVDRVHKDRVTLRDIKIEDNNSSYDIPADIVILSSGSEPNSLLEKIHEFPKCPKNGKVLIEETLRVKGFKNVYAGGDCSQVKDMKLPSTAQVAMQQSNTIADNLAIQLFSSTLNDANLNKFQYIPLGEMLTLGFKEAAINGFGGLVQVDGPIAALGRRLVYALRMPTTGQSVTALLNAGLVTAGNIISKLSKRQ